MINKEKKKTYNKNYIKINKDKLKNYYREYRKKHRNELKNNYDKFIKKHKDEMKQYYKRYKQEYRKINKEKIAKYFKNYRKTHQEKLLNYYKKHRKNLYNKAIERICNHYNMPKVCFFCGKKQSIRNGKLDLCIEHKNEKLGGKKDELKGTNLYKHILKCNDNEINNYQVLCNDCNIMKEQVFEMMVELKTEDSEKYEKLLNIYNSTLIKEDKNNAKTDKK